MGHDSPLHRGSNILLIGLGSIGKRHLRNILSLGYSNISVVSRSGKLPEKFDQLAVYQSIDDALHASTFDAAIIATPTALHISSLMPLLKAGIKNIYLEKPVSHSYEGIEELVANAKLSQTNIIVGFDLHFDPGMQKVKELLNNKTIGKVISVNAQVGQYLPDWRPQEDYSKGMSARKETGGGVMLDLVHEFDYLHWLIGSVEIIACFYNNSGALQIETEDIAEVLLKFENGVIGTIHLDYLQPKLVRNCMLTGSKGSIVWNLAESKVSWINHNKEADEFDYKGFERNDRFIQIMQAFLEGNNDDRLTNLTNGLASLKMVLAAKQSSQQNSFVQLNNFQPQ